MARFGVFLDACVLVPISVADTILRLADRELFRPMWSEMVLAEAREAVLRVHPDMDASRIDARLRSMDEAFPDALVTGWESLVSAVELPDPDDRHVLAAALRGRADLIVTNNLKDFPSPVLSALGIEAVSPDDFLLDQLDLAPEITKDVIERQASDTRRPAITVEGLLGSLSRAGVPQFASALAEPLPDAL